MESLRVTFCPAISFMFRIQEVEKVINNVLVYDNLLTLSLPTSKNDRLDLVYHGEK